jgi:hypothetical protein
LVKVTAATVLFLRQQHLSTAGFAISQSARQFKFQQLLIFGLLLPEKPVECSMIHFGFPLSQPARTAAADLNSRAGH